MRKLDSFYYGKSDKRDRVFGFHYNANRCKRKKTPRQQYTHVKPTGPAPDNQHKMNPVKFVLTAIIVILLAALLAGCTDIPTLI